jgi:hypothetical protein
VDASDLAVNEAEQQALADLALAELLAGGGAAETDVPVALPDLTKKREPVRAAHRAPRKTHKSK